MFILTFLYFSYKMNPQGKEQNKSLEFNICSY